MILQFYLTECLWIINLIYNFRFLNFIENGASEASVNCFQDRERKKSIGTGFFMLSRSKPFLN